MEEKIFAIRSLELANHEIVQKYCYRPVRQSFIQQAIENIQVKCVNLPKHEKPVMPELVEAEAIDVSAPLGTINEEMSPTTPLTVPEPTTTTTTTTTNNNNNNSNTTLTLNPPASSMTNDKVISEEEAKNISNSLNNVAVNHIAVEHGKMDSFNQTDSSPEVAKDSEPVTKNESDSNDISKTDPTLLDSTPEKTESSIKRESLSSKNINNTTTDNEDTTLGSGGNVSKSQDLKSQESIKLKLIDVVLPEDITSSQSNFIFTYEESIRSSQANLDDVTRSQTIASDRNTVGSIGNS
ncbi:hypothetical protein PIROE2DRAFT_17502 [Piromyces sp. E2]|nr:hypothetical protein PIROE2DRAFT_17502 [Piromyces sp. E2]|eukprot:OUM57504.1 hypothetical protein PIROE2DRAFT_17502 [Piromyces sp. E2]